MIVYKVVRHRGNKVFCSSIVAGKAKKLYIPGTAHHAPRWLACQGYYITAFGELEYAREFRKRVASKIWKCEATGITRYNRLPKRCYLADLCNGVLKTSTSSYDIRWPEGTIMCKTLKLIKEVT